MHFRYVAAPPPVLLQNRLINNSIHSSVSSPLLPNSIHSSRFSSLPPLLIRTPSWSYQKFGTRRRFDCRGDQLSSGQSVSTVRGQYLIPSARSYPGLCFCKSLQTSTYEVVKGSYVPTAQIKQESKTELFVHYEFKGQGRPRFGVSLGLFVDCLNTFSVPGKSSLIEIQYSGPDMQLLIKFYLGKNGNKYMLRVPASRRTNQKMVSNS